ncbi:hypothetical protein NEUTE1DRAFT_121434 [Neurospora tetrasperma FGSC 2508]|uniref:Uncharacterized protein n=1 Tax=Neurospora tetrasperma (strain FGSC 2508 / ATCC MYA-4615 / P0657) TaxID=510951 RepID=F8MHR7_NEUT8|nr:uncharacterized protein NEUTE1DRAFT_121434 [Neurospora tetrasperma FGSC 2508]EGO59678.1 hypothetical protein NEUTE1DRAFT_121434 [Neurospora tetrasperma FGSC 2508]EGZ73814.1 hypothetical protein NEUTE2DRAFT_157201 [Neurospora tetrasperma FGSC 2509]
MPPLRSQALRPWSRNYVKLKADTRKSLQLVCPKDEKFLTSPTWFNYRAPGELAKVTNYSPSDTSRCADITQFARDYTRRKPHRQLEEEEEEEEEEVIVLTRWHVLFVERNFIARSVGSRMYLRMHATTIDTRYFTSFSMLQDEMASRRLDETYDGISMPTMYSSLAQILNTTEDCRKQYNQYPASLVLQTRFSRLRSLNRIHDLLDGYSAARSESYHRIPR